MIVLSRYVFRTFFLILYWLAFDGVLGWCIFCPFQKALFQGEFIAKAWHLWKKGTNTKRYKCPKWFKTTTYCLISWQLGNGAWHNNATATLQPTSSSQFHPESAILCIFHCKSPGAVKMAFLLSLLLIPRWTVIEIISNRNELAANISCSIGFCSLLYCLDSDFPRYVIYFGWWWAMYCTEIICICHS